MEWAGVGLLNSAPFASLTHAAHGSHEGRLMRCPPTSAPVPPLLNPLPRRGEGTRLKDVLAIYNGSWVGVIVCSVFLLGPRVRGDDDLGGGINERNA